MVIWLIGISGSGKTTLGVELKKWFDGLSKASCIIDGDLVRGFYDNDLGYSREERVANIKRIMLAAYLLDRTDVAAIVCNISPFEELRKFARQKIAGYNEIYLKKSLEKSRADDVKNMYGDNIGKTEIVGIDLGFDEPAKSDLTINVDEETVEESLKRITAFISKKYGQELR
ncbi:MAG: adenylyl-sulfate kinase [Sedimentisphaerales bacterium]|nr:adenylyl-sulfate kinase [Sedimentisphaerales bacterium]